MTKNQINKYWAAAIFVYMLVHILLIPQQLGEQAISDKGVISILTILFASIALIRLILTINSISAKSLRVPLYMLAYIILIYILREADFHRLFTDEHITKDKFYTDPDIDIKQKLIGGIPLGIFFICFFYVLIRYFKLTLIHLKQLRPWAVATFLWVTTIFISQVIDKSSLNYIYNGRVLEELLEFCAAGYMLIAVLFSTKLLIKYDLTKV